ncbi:MAG: chorismate mutase [Burkholderiales bacterium]
MKSPRACRNLTDIRVAVNTIDRAIVKLLGQRTGYAKAALQFKTDRKSIGNPAHRKKVFAQRKAWARQYGVNDKMLHKVYLAILNESRRIHLAGFGKRR